MTIPRSADAGWWKLVTTLILMCASTLAFAGPVEGDLQPSWIIELPASVSGVLVADTSDASLHRFERIGDQYHWVDEHYMSIGQNGVAKDRAWDKRTPLGNYFITERLDTSRMHDKYGAAAFPLDYPNAWDRRMSRTGYGIWLHGVDKNNPERPTLDTDGCLAIRNETLLELAPYLVPLLTPVIVVGGMEWATAADTEVRRGEFRLALDRWKESVLEGDLVSYLSLYDSEFSHRGMNKADWSAWRLQVFESRTLTQLGLTDIMLLADPREENLYMSRFTQSMQHGEQSVRTVKRLYWKRSAESRWSIVAEDAG